MRRIFILSISWLSIAFVHAQNAEEFEITINGKKEKITIQKQYKVVTPQGDTIVYNFNDVVEELKQEQAAEDNEKLQQQTQDVQEEKARASAKQEKAVTETKQNVVKAEVKSQPKTEEKTVAVSISDTAAAKPVIEKKLAESKQVMIEAAKAKQVQEVEEKKAAMEAEIKLIEAKKEVKSEEVILNEEPKKALVPENLIYNKPVVAEIKPAEGIVLKEDKAATVISKPAETIAAPEKMITKVQATPAKAVVETEVKTAGEAKSNLYAFKKYFVADQTINAQNIAEKDTLKLIATELSAYKNFPSFQFGALNEITLCYDESVCSYHGYDEELIAKYTTKYKVCQTGTWSELAKSAETYVTTPAGKKKLRYTIVQLDAQNLVLVKR